MQQIWGYSLVHVHVYNKCQVIVFQVRQSVHSCNWLRKDFIKSEWGWIWEHWKWPNFEMLSTYMTNTLHADRFLTLSQNFLLQKCNCLITSFSILTCMCICTNNTSMIILRRLPDLTQTPRQEERLSIRYVYSQYKSGCLLSGNN